jgi:hypothetical protein
MASAFGKVLDVREVASSQPGQAGNSLGVEGWQGWLACAELGSQPSHPVTLVKFLGLPEPLILLCHLAFSGA